MRKQENCSCRDKYKEIVIVIITTIRCSHNNRATTTAVDIYRKKKKEKCSKIEKSFLKQCGKKSQP